MGYRALETGRRYSEQTISSFGATKGQNIVVSSELLGPEYAQETVNYKTVQQGLIEKTGGSLLEKDFNVENFSLYHEVNEDLVLIGYETTLAKYVPSTDTVTIIKNDFGTGDFTGVEYGDIFYVCNGTTKIGKVNATLTTWTEIADAPKSTILYIFDSRLFSNDVDNPGIIKYSEKFNFDNFTTASTPLDATDPGTINGEAYGTVTSISSWGSQIVGGYTKGKSGSRIDVVDVYNIGLAQNLITDWQYKDYGMNKAALNSTAGFFYTNSKGIWRLFSGGSTTQPFSIREENITKNVYTEEFMANIDFSDNDIFYDDILDIVYVTCRKSSSFNNFVFAYNIGNKSFHTMEGLQIKKFFKKDNEVYGISSIDGTFQRLFTVGSQLDTSTRSVFKFEVTSKMGLNGLSGLNNFTIKGEFNTNSKLDIYFDIYNNQGLLQEGREKITLEVNKGNFKNKLEGFNTVSFGESTLGGGYIDGELIEILASKRVRISKFTRLIVRIVCEDKFLHKINYIQLGVRQKGLNRIKQNLI